MCADSALLCYACGQTGLVVKRDFPTIGKLLKQYRKQYRGIIGQIPEKISGTVSEKRSARYRKKYRKNYRKNIGQISEQISGKYSTIILSESQLTSACACRAAPPNCRVLRLLFRGLCCAMLVVIRDFRTMMVNLLKTISKTISGNYWKKIS